MQNIARPMRDKFKSLLKRFLKLTEMKGKRLSKNPRTETIYIKEDELGVFTQGVESTHFVEIKDRTAIVCKDGRLWHKVELYYDTPVDLYYLGQQVLIRTKIHINRD